MAVTRAEVAELAGVSPAVVSYVVNGGPRPVSGPTRARVEAAIKSLGYRPNAIAAALRGGTTRSIGLVTPSLTNPFFAEVAQALEFEMFSISHTLSIGMTDDDPSRELLYLQSFVDRRVDGLIMMSSRTVVNLHRLGADAIPVVVMDRVEDLGSVSSVHVDNKHAAAYGVEHLQGHGHRQIGCVTGPWPVALSAHRVEGWRAQQDVIGADSSDYLVEHAEFSEGGGAAAARGLLGKEGRRHAAGAQRPTAIFVSSDIQAIGVVYACHQLGLRVPEDVAVVSVDGTRVGSYTHPTLTSMRQPVAEMARVALASLLKRIAGDPTVQHSVLRGNLVIGRSCGCS